MADTSMLMSMTDMSISMRGADDVAQSSDSVRSIDMEMLLDTLENSVGSGVTTTTHRNRLTAALRQTR